MKKLFSLLLFFIFFYAQADALSLLNNLKEADIGDYVVIAENRQYTLLLVQSKKNSLLYLDEISVPESQFKDLNISFKQWMNQNAPKNTSWVTYALNLNNGVIVKVFSWTKQGFFQPQQEIFTTLLNLHYQEIPNKERRRIGNPTPGGVDRRKIWQPPLYRDGKRIFDAKFIAYKAVWPSDGSELSNKSIEIYLPDNIAGVPNYFPFWLNVKGTASMAKLRLIDSGTKMTPQKLGMP
ncbi:MAG: hypothetical protein JHC93_05760 [Parachlamydiales bacterium]|nr:hypothetical protein [Parachlamydiales bacterium]